MIIAEKFVVVLMDDALAMLGMHWGCCDVTEGASILSSGGCKQTTMGLNSIQEANIMWNVLNGYLKT